MAQPDSTESLSTTQSPIYFAAALDDAERLLKYAAEIGVHVSDETRGAILHARAVYPQGWTEQVAAKLLAALTSLAAALKPVSADSLKAYNDDTRTTVRYYLRVAITLACIIVPVSVASFVSNAISNALRTDISTANDLAVQLRAQLGAVPPATSNPTSGVTPIPPGADETAIITELQSYAATIRVIYSRSSELRWLVLPHETIVYSEDGSDPKKRRTRFELPPNLPNYYTTRDQLTSTYQDVRYYAQTLLNDSSVFYGAITTCILPALYALLGTCAYLLRTFEDEMSRRTFTPSVANSARFLIAGIGGAVVGLFNNLAVSQQVSIPPLALAFLMGYAVDVFFAFLEGIIRAFTKDVPAAYSIPHRRSPE
jgi:hypothetical protein